MENNENSADAKIEKEIYRSCLKQVVNFLNTTLPPIPDSDESDDVETKTKKQAGNKDKSKSKEKPLEKEDIKNSYKIKDTVPTRVKTPVKEKQKTPVKKTRSYKPKVDNFKSKKSNK